ncbi:caspase family protein [Scytonema sp. NUACC26]|uniref:nSTAND1 domain-containing NTPase n=1 Tax=Scytonema sp. NUACC26 TaxID=3140176 RepID=UPI0034DBFA57
MSKFTRNLALIVGINDYVNGISPLQNAVNDAKKLVEILRDKHGYQVWECFDEGATLQPLKKFLLETLPQEVKSNDRLLFYFAGHGIALNGDDGPQGYLIPQDAKLGEIETYLPMTQVHESLNSLSCRHFLGIFDCCFAGAFRWSATRNAMSVSKVLHKERYDRFISSPAWQVITSAASDQKALDAFYHNTNRGSFGEHSPFAAALFEALTGAGDAYPPAIDGKPAGDGVMTATELYMYLRHRVEEVAGQNRSQQTPGIWGLNKHDKGEYIFLTPGHKLNLPSAPPLDESQNPYRGLQSFEEEHCNLFFGRSVLVEKLHHFVTTHPLTIVLGASGSGKSSVVKAGLIPQMRRTKEDNWCIVPAIRLGKSPFLALNQVLAQLNLPKIAGQIKLTDSIAAWVTQNTNSKLFLLIDQSEELISLCQNEEERREFFKQLVEAIANHSQVLRVLLTLRSDFEPQIRNYHTQKQDWQDARFIVPTMKRAELREAIEKPTEARVMFFQPTDLVDNLIDEIADMPGALPLLSFTLSELYIKYLKRQHEAKIQGETIDRAITKADYDELGGVTQSLTRRADLEYEQLVQENPAYARIIRHIMLRMVALSGGELARRQVPLSELQYPLGKNELAQKAISRFSQARLLVEGQDIEGQSYVEPAHDALVRGWGKLREWIKQEEDEETIILQRRLTPDAEKWKTKQPEKFQWKKYPYWVKYFQEKYQQSRYLWNANPDLLKLKDKLHSPDNWYNQIEEEFIRNSIQLRQNNRSLRIGAIASVFLSIVTFAAFQSYQRQEAEIRALAASSEALFVSGRQLDGLRDALKAAQILKSTTGIVASDTTRKQVMTALMQAVSLIKEKNIIQGHDNQVRSVRFSPDGLFLASSSDDRTVRIWSTANGEEIVRFRGHKNRVNNVNFSPDGKILASSDWDGRIKLWSLVNSREITPPSLIGHPNNPVYSVSFNRYGTVLVSAGWDGTIKLWRVADGKLIKTLTEHQQNVENKTNKINVINFSADGRQMVSSTEDGTIYLWDWDENKQDAKLRKRWKGHEDNVIGVVFSPNGKILASASFDNKVKLWSVPDGKPISTLTGHKNRVYSVSFSPNGQMLASAGSDRTVILWGLDNLEQPKEIQEIATFIGHNDEIYSVRFSPDGKTLASTGADKHIRFWSLDNDALKQLTIHKDRINAVSFQPVISNNEYMFTSAGTDRNIQFWSLTKNGKVTLLRKANLLQNQEHTGPINSLSFSPNGKVLASGSADVSVKVWDATTRQLMQTLPENPENKLGTNYVVNFSPNGKILAAAYATRKIKFWQIAQNGYEEIKPINPSMKGYSVNFSPDGSAIATILDDGVIKLWQFSALQKEIKLKEHTGVVYSLSFSPDSQILASASEDNTIKLWSMTNYKVTHTLKGHTGAVRNISFSPDGQILASASEDNTIKLWDRNGKELIALKGHSAPVLSLSFSPDGKYLISGSTDKTVLLWDLKLKDLDVLFKRGCQWSSAYLIGNTSLNQEDKSLCGTDR